MRKEKAAKGNKLLRKRALRIPGILVPFALFLALILCCSCESETTDDGALRETARNHDEMIALIREGYRTHSAAITLRFTEREGLERDFASLVPEWIEEAMAETGRADEGDYIRCQNGGYTLSIKTESSGGGTRKSITIRPKYYTYPSQEEKVSEKVEEILSGLKISDAVSDYEKIEAVYEYLCSNVRYDEVHEGNPYHALRSSAYGALVRENATCMGYSVAMYRLLRELGVECRVVRGRAINDLGEEKEHAWNAVTADGKALFLDATWDAGRDDYRYFLRSAEDFPLHEADPDQKIF